MTLPNSYKIDIDSLFVKADLVCNFIPGISTVTNLITIVAKFALNKLSAAWPDWNDSIKDRPWKKYLDLKDYRLCLLLCIPVVSVHFASLMGKKWLAQPQESAAVKEARQLVTDMKKLNEDVTKLREDGAELREDLKGLEEEMDLNRTKLEQIQSLLKECQNGNV